MQRDDNVKTQGDDGPSLRSQGNTLTADTLTLKSLLTL